LGANKAHDLADRGKIETLRIGARRVLFGEPVAKSGEHLGFQLVQIVARDGFGCRDRNRVAVVHFKYPASQRQMVLVTAVVTPSRHGHSKYRKEVGMPWQDAECAGFVFGPQMYNVTGINNDGERGRNGQSHGAPALASASLCRASVKSPIM
jgi:hypothetical protein